MVVPCPQRGQVMTQVSGLVRTTDEVAILLFLLPHEREAYEPATPAADIDFQINSCTDFSPSNPDSLPGGAALLQFNPLQGAIPRSLLRERSETGSF